MKLLVVDEDGAIQKPEIKPEMDFSAYDDDKFKQDPYVSEWINNLQHKKEGGKPKKTWRNDYNKFKRSCNFMKLKPAQWVGITRKEFEDRMTVMRDRIVAEPHTLEGMKNVSNPETVWHTLKMACRLFCSYYGTSLPKNIGGVLSGKVIGHGKYKDLRLSDIEISKGDSYIIAKHGLDSDIFRVWRVGIESGARMTALLGMDCDWNEFQHGNDTWFEMKAYETKTETKWSKYIYGKQTQESLTIHRSNGFKKIVSFNVNRANYSPIADLLRDVYIFLGKEHSHDGYYMKKPYHVLRHIATQCWIRKSKGNLTMVRKACGWTSDLELEASYGELPPEIVIGMLPTETAA